MLLAAEGVANSHVAVMCGVRPNTQTRQCESVAGPASAFSSAFHPDIFILAELVERWFRELTDKALRRGVCHSVPDLINKIEEYVEANNTSPQPVVWTATAESILTKVTRGRVALEKVHQN